MVVDRSSEKRWSSKLGKAERLLDLETLIQRSCMMENMVVNTARVRVVVVVSFLNVEEVLTEDENRIFTAIVRN